MSSEALGWAFRQDIKPSALKFTLVALAECANYRTGKIFPSIAHLCEITGQDRKTIIANIAKLEDLGLLEDTGETVGKTGQIKVYMLNLSVGRQNSVQECHYVYKLSEPKTDEFYIGVRSFLGDPNNDPYRGSGCWPKGQSYHGVSLDKDILAVFKTRSDAERYEVELIENNIKNPLCRNIYKQSQKRDNFGFGGDLNSPKNGAKQSQKRDTEPSSNPQAYSQPTVVRMRRNNPVFPPPEGVTDETWQAFLDGPRKKHPITPKAYSLILKAIETSAGTPEATIEQSILNDWRGVFPLKQERAGNGKRSGWLPTR